MEALRKEVGAEEAFHCLLTSLVAPLVEEVVVGRHKHSMQSKDCMRRRQWLILQGSQVGEVVLHLLLSQCSMGRWRLMEVVEAEVRPSDGVVAMVLQRLKEGEEEVR